MKKADEVYDKKDKDKLSVKQIDIEVISIRSKTKTRQNSEGAVSLEVQEMIDSSEKGKTFMINKNDYLNSPFVKHNKLIVVINPDQEIHLKFKTFFDKLGGS